MSSITCFYYSFDSMCHSAGTQDLMPLRFCFFQKNRFTRCIQETMVCFSGTTDIAACMIPYSVYNAEFNTIIGLYGNIDIHSFTKAGHGLILGHRLRRAGRTGQPLQQLGPLDGFVFPCLCLSTVAQGDVQRLVVSDVRFSPLLCVLINPPL